ncbi:MAG: DNA gyrase subunit A, partial [Rickettsiales bacterium]
LEHEKIIQELDSLISEVEEYNEILNNRTKLMTILKDEFNKIKDEFSTPRLTQIEITEWESDIESLIQKEEMVVTVTEGGYIKRVPLSTYKSQKRGGKGRSGIKMRDEDLITDLFIANTHSKILFFSNIGKVYRLKLHRIPIGNLQAKGKALINIFPLASGEFINNVMAIPEDESTLNELNIIFTTAKGKIRRNDFSDFHNINSSGKIAIKLESDNKLIGVRLCKNTDHILLSSKLGKALRFPVSKLRIFKSRASEGVKGMKLAENDELISITILHGAEINADVKESYFKIPIDDRINIAKFEDLQASEEFIKSFNNILPLEQIYKLAKEEEVILTVTANGFGKRTSAYDYRITNKGGKGIINIITSERNGEVIASFPVICNNQIMIMSNKGTIIRCPVNDIRITGRNTRG